MAITAENGRTAQVRLVVNPRARRLILRLDRQTHEAVAVAPSARKLKAAAEFARSRADWIFAQLDRVSQTVPFTESGLFPLRGKPCRLTAEGSGRLPMLEEGDPATLRLPGAPETLPARAVRYLKKAARADLEAAVARHAETLDVRPARISIRDTRSRWGSCSQSGNLSFSWRLVLAPPDILDYVAAHEVAHLIEMNHSPRFWAQVERTFPGWKQARNWLKTEGNRLHAVGL